MIFLDESGKRWRHIKHGTTLLSSTALITVGILFIASLLYLPSWGGISLPKPFHVSHEPSATTSSVLSRQDTKKKNGTNATTSPAQTEGSTLLTNSSSASASLPSGAVLTSTASTPPQADSGLSNQPAQTGKSDYGHTHQTIPS